MIHVDRIADFASVDALRESWNALTTDQPFRSFDWLGSWAETYLTDKQLYLLAARDQQKLVGILPLFRSTSAGRGRVLQWLGSGEVCTDYQGIIAGDEDSESVIDAFAQWLVEAAATQQDGWDLIQLEAVDLEEPSVQRLQSLLGELDCTLHEQPGMNCWRVELPKSWDEYLALMSKSHRKQLRRVERRLLDHPDTRIVSTDDETQFARGMEVLVDLHQKRRLSLGEPGCFASAQFSDFLHKAALRLLASGRLRLTWAEVAGEPIACEFQVAGPSITFAYQAGIDPDRMEMEPGRLIMIATIMQAIESGRTAMDFLRGDEAYKPHFRATARPSKEVRVVAPQSSSQLRHKIWLAGTSLKEFVQTRVPVSGS